MQQRLPAEIGIGLALVGGTGRMILFKGVAPAAPVVRDWGILGLDALEYNDIFFYSLVAGFSYFVCHVPIFGPFLPRL